MMTYYKDVKQNGVSRLTVTPDICEECWINMTNPTEAEVREISETLNIDRDFLMAAMDADERSRIDYDHEMSQTLIVVHMPFMTILKDSSKLYDTQPLGIIIAGTRLVTVCADESRILTQLTSGSIKNVKVKRRSEFIWTMLKRIAALYQSDLIQIDKLSSSIEEGLLKSMKNKELIQLLGLEKSLVYFSTSLKSNEVVMEKLLRTNYIEKFEEDSELLEEAIIENKQAIEMAKIYSDILSGTMDAFASIISNNLNIVMKFLAGITIVMSIPTMISSFFGMNVAVPLQGNPYAFAIILGVSIAVCLIIAWIMAKRDMF